MVATIAQNKIMENVAERPSVSDGFVVRTICFMRKGHSTLPTTIFEICYTNGIGAVKNLTLVALLSVDLVPHKDVMQIIEPFE